MLLLLACVPLLLIIITYWYDNYSGAILSFSWLIHAEFLSLVSFFIIILNEIAFIDRWEKVSCFVYRWVAVLSDKCTASLDKNPTLLKWISSSLKVKSCWFSRSTYTSVIKWKSYYLSNRCDINKSRNAECFKKIWSMLIIWYDKTDKK